MEHVPTTESQVEKVYRIASELGIGLEDAAITYAGFELAFSDESLRRAIFGMIDELDDEAFKNGEPLGMILSYAVELGTDGISVTRHANEIPPGQVVSLTPTNRAMIFVKIKNNFPTQRFLGPLIVSRPDWEFAVKSREGEFDGAGGERPVSRNSFDTEIPADLSAHEPTEAVVSAPARTVICLGPIRHTFSERFPFVSVGASRTQRMGATTLGSACGPAVKPLRHLPPWGALLPAFHSTSGLSPPPAIGERGHSVSKDVPRPVAIIVETCVSHLDL